MTTPTNNTTPSYTFSSSEARTITYGGSCSSATTDAISGNNTIILNALDYGTYSDCTIIVTNASGNISENITLSSFTVEREALSLLEITSISTPNNNKTPSYTFSSSEAGTITYGGSCSSATTNAVSGNNTITLNSLSAGTYSDCTITVTDSFDRSSTINISQFIFFPEVSLLTLTDNRASGEEEAGKGVAVGSDGAFYVVGSTTRDIDGSGVNTYSGGSDIFIIKYNLSSEKQWTKQIGTARNDSSSAVAVDSDNNIYITGSTNGDIDGSGANTHSGGSDIFLIKYNPIGAEQWTKQIGTVSNDSSSAVAVDSDNNIYITGYTYGDIDGSASNTHAGGTDVFLIKYNFSGAEQWTKQIGTSSSDLGSAVAVDSDNNIYITGSTNGDIDGSGANTHAGVNDIFLIKYNSSGTDQWTKQTGTSSNDYSNAVAVDSNNSIYITGRDDASPYSNIVLYKYNSSGAEQWNKKYSSLSDLNDYGYGVAVDSSNNIFIAGKKKLGAPGSYSYGNSVFFKCDSNGDLIWQKEMPSGGASFVSANGVAVDSNDFVYVTGDHGNENINQGFVYRFPSSLTSSPSSENE